MLRKLNLRTLLILVICLTGISVIYQRPLLQFALTLFTLLLIFSQNPARKSLQSLQKRLLRVGKIIIIIFIFQLLFRRQGEILWQFGFLIITSQGLNYALASSLRFLLIILVAALLMDVPFQDYLIALRAWKFPPEISFLVASTIHFLPVFQNIFQTKMETLQLRHIELKNLPLKQRLSLFRLLIIPVLAAAIHDIRFRSISLELRAFRLYPNSTSLHHNALHLLDYLTITFTLSLTLGTFILLK